MNNVLIPLNFNESPSQLLKLCQFITNLGSKKYYLFHVGSTTGRLGKHNKKKINSYAEFISNEGFETETMIESGSVQNEIVNTAEKCDVHFICFPFKKKSWFKKALLGSTIKNVVRQSDIPVFVFREPTRKQIIDDSFRVLYATSLQGRDDVITSYIRQDNFQVDEVIFLHVRRRAPDPYVDKQNNDIIEEKLNELVEKCNLKQKQSFYITSLGNPRKVIIKIAKQINSDLILIGKADISITSEPVFGSTAEEVSYNSPCSVLIIPKLDHN